MDLLEWKPEYSVGIESVDFEHRQMIDLINEIYGEMREDCDAQAIEECLGDIHSAIAMHFALEERLMREAHYEEYADHKDDHEELLDQIRDLMELIEEDPESGLGVLGEQLSAWFRVHFSTFDARLHDNLDVSH